LNGRLAQLGERLVRNEEVASSNLVPSIEEAGMAFIGGSAYAMAKDVGDGYILLNATLLKRLSVEELRSLRFEVERLLTSIRGEQPAVDDTAAIQQKNRKISRLASAVSLVNNQILQHR
jgi:hypothetical protein